MQGCLKICQDEILNYLNDKRKEGIDTYFTRAEIEKQLYPNNQNNKVKRALRQLVSYGEIEITFKIISKGGLTGGFTPCYRGKIEAVKTIQNNS